MKDVLNSRHKFYFDERNGTKLMKSIRIDKKMLVILWGFGYVRASLMKQLNTFERVFLSERVYFETASIHLNKNVLPI